jgi:hypothetical protein
MFVVGSELRIADRKRVSSSINDVSGGPRQAITALHYSLMISVLGFLLKSVIKNIKGMEIKKSNAIRKNT